MQLSPPFQMDTHTIAESWNSEMFMRKFDDISSPSWIVEMLLPGAIFRFVSWKCIWMPCSFRWNHLIAVLWKTHASTLRHIYICVMLNMQRIIYMYKWIYKTPSVHGVKFLHLHLGICVRVVYEIRTPNTSLGNLSFDLGIYISALKYHQYVGLVQAGRSAYHPQDKTLEVKMK